MRESVRSRTALTTVFPILLTTSVALVDAFAPRSPLPWCAATRFHDHVGGENNGGAHDVRRYVTAEPVAFESTDEDEGVNKKRVEVKSMKKRVKYLKSHRPHLKNKKRASADLDRDFLQRKTELLLRLTDDRDETSEQDLSEKMRVNKSTFHWLIDAWGMHEGGCEHAEKLVRRMQDLHEREGGFAPNVRLLTKAIQCIGRSGVADAGPRAEKMLRWMDDLAESGRNPSVRPNSLTYTAVIEAYAHCRRPNRAVGGSHVAHDDDDPTADHARRAEELFTVMESRDDVRPTARTHHALIVAWSRSPEAGAADHARDLLYHAHDHSNDADDDDDDESNNSNNGHQLTPSSFNAVVDAYAKSGDPNAVAEAERIVARMRDAGKKSGLYPNTATYNSLLNVYAKSGQPDAAYRAEDTLDRMIEEGVAPDVTSYSTVVHAWARSHNFGKAEHALKVLDRMSEATDCRPNVIVLNSVMNACAFTRDNELEGGRALDIAHTMFRRLEDGYGLRPDDVTYGTYLKVCANHMPPDDDDGDLRGRVVNVVLKRCKADGQIGGMVLQQLRALADDDDYRRLLGGLSKDDPLDKVPEEWRRNVRDRRHGRRHHHRRSNTHNHDGRT